MKLFLEKSFVGLSDQDNKGIFGGFKFGSGLDVRKDMDSLSPGQALTDDIAAGTMDSLPLFIVNCSNGSSYFFLRNGKIYKRTSSRDYSLVYTDADGVITGAAEWVNDQGHKFLYWATPTKLRRKQIPGTGVEPWNDVDATVNSQSYPKTNLTAATWHTMNVMGGDLHICNASNLAFVGFDDSYTNDALQLEPGNNSKCLMEYGNYAYIGCSRDDNAQRGYLFIWDMSQSLNWNGKRKQGAVPVNALIEAEFPLAQIGSDGKIVLADLSQYSLPIKSFPGGGQVNPDGVEADHLAYFGAFGNDADEDDRIRTGVYTFGRLHKNASPVLNLEYPLDCDEIGSVKKVGTDFLITYWKSGVGYGVKRVDSLRKGTGIYSSKDYRAPVSVKEPVWQKVRLVMKPLPTGCSVSVRRKINKTGGFVTCKLIDGSSSFTTVGGTEAYFLMGDKGKICEVEITLNSYENTCPEVYQIETIFE